jgi:hypothetical protein
MEHRPVSQQAADFRPAPGRWKDSSSLTLPWLNPPEAMESPSDQVRFSDLCAL